jgi:acetylglutamate kinase
LPKEHSPNGTIVVKIGGSTLGEHDTTLEDLVSLQREGANPVVVHGGGKTISEWMAAQNVRPVFKNGLRVTDKDSLQIVVAVLAGLINKELVSQLVAAGAKAIGLSGADGGMLTAAVKDPELGYVGEIRKVDTAPILAASQAGYIPVIAPVARCPADEPTYPNSLMNINADTAAGEIAGALKADQLYFLTDVEGVLDRGHRLISRITERQAEALTSTGTISGGMIPKIEACVRALKSGSESRIIDGRKPGALRQSLNGAALGTRIG